MKKDLAIRNTKQKRVVAQVFEDAGRPLTVAEVLSRAQKSIPGLGIATVYREIGRLVGADTLATVNIPNDPPRYEAAHHHHHHFKCTRCKTVFELEGCLKDVDRLAPKGFKTKEHDITLYGLCRKCA